MGAGSNLIREMAIARPLATINARPRAESGRRHMRTRMLFLCAGALLSSHAADAQRIEALGPQVRKYVSVGTTKVILQHVQVIDGTGVAAVADQNISIQDGKITTILRWLLGHDGSGLFYAGEPAQRTALPANF